MIDKKTVLKVADLARLDIPESQQQSLENQFNKILNYFEDLKNVDTENIEPMVTPHDLVSELRADKVQKDLSVDEILKNAPDVKDSLFKVPPVV